MSANVHVSYIYSDENKTIHYADRVVLTECVNTLFVMDFKQDIAKELHTTPEHIVITNIYKLCCDPEDRA